MSLESSWSQVSNVLNLSLIQFFYKKLCPKDWTCIKFHHKQTLNDHHLSLGYQNWAYNISLERFWSIGSNDANIAVMWFSYQTFSGKRVIMYQISTQNVWLGLFLDFKKLFSFLKLIFYILL